MEIIIICVIFLIGVTGVAVSDGIKELREEAAAEYRKEQEWQRKYENK